MDEPTGEVTAMGSPAAREIPTTAAEMRSTGDDASTPKTSRARKSAAAASEMSTAATHERTSASPATSATKHFWFPNATSAPSTATTKQRFLSCQ